MLSDFTKLCLEATDLYDSAKNAQYNCLQDQLRCHEPQRSGKCTKYPFLEIEIFWN